MSVCAGDERFIALFMEESHHLNLNIMFIAQNIFYKGKEMRNVSLNCQYLILFKNRRDIN